MCVFGSRIFFWATYWVYALGAYSGRIEMVEVQMMAASRPAS